MSEAAFDIAGGLGLAESRGILAPGCEPAGDRGLQPSKAVEARAPDDLTVIRADQRSTTLSHDAPVGVKGR